MLYKKENITKIKNLLDSNILTLKNDRLYYYGDMLSISPKTQTYTLYYDDKLFQPKAALVACIVLGLEVPARTELNLSSEEIRIENIVHKVKEQSSYNSNPKNRKFTKETCIQLRRDYRSGNFTYRELEKKHNLSRPQIASILYKVSNADFWKDVDKEEKPLTKGEIVKKTKKQPPRILTKEHRMNISEKMKKYHASAIRQTNQAKTKVKIEKPIKEKLIKKEVKKELSLYDIFMSEAKAAMKKK